jgi:hypothetical protein
MSTTPESLPPSSAGKSVDSLNPKERSELAVDVLRIVREQDDLVHGWARTLIVTQGAEAVALGAVWTRLAEDPILRTVAVLTIAAVGIITCWVCIAVAISDLQWQGRYIAYVRQLDPTGVLYPDKPNQRSDKYNRGVQATWFHRLRIVLTGAWLVSMVAVLAVLLR